MKKHLLLFTLVFIAISGYGQGLIPNGSFETWNSASYEVPQSYPYSSNLDNAPEFINNVQPFNLIKTTDSKFGTYGVQLSTVSVGSGSAFAYFLNSNPQSGDPSTWKGGMPISEKPTGIRGYYKYNQASGDAGTLIVTFSKAGTNIGSYIYPIGGIQSTYTLFDFTFTPALTLTPDSMIFGAASSNVAGSGVVGSVLILDSVSLTGVVSQPAAMNGDFEIWDNTTVSALANWYVQDNVIQGVSKSTDKITGNYAVQLTTFLGKRNNQPAAEASTISTGYYPFNCNGNCYQLGGTPYNKSLDTLVFYYKYSPSGIDSAQVNLNFKKNGIPIYSTGTYLLASASYQRVEIPFEIFFQSPDSVIVGFQSSTWRDSLISFVGSTLLIDDVHFKSEELPTGISNYKMDNSSISISPNPVTDAFQVKGITGEATLTILDMNGKSLLSKKVTTADNVPVNSLPQGVYLVKITTPLGTVERKLLKK